MVKHPLFRIEPIAYRAGRVGGGFKVVSGVGRDLFTHATFRADTRPESFGEAEVKAKQFILDMNETRKEITLTVMHLTDAGTGNRPVALGRSEWFNEEGARDHAREQSACHPAPQRFAVYDEHDRWLVTYQCGQELPAFTIV